MILLCIKQFQSYLSESTYESRTDSRHRQITVPFSTVLILTFGSTILLFSKYKGSFLSLGIKQPGYKAEHSHHPVPRLGMQRTIPSLLHMPSRQGA